jgi:hypothetical protein
LKRIGCLHPRRAVQRRRGAAGVLVAFCCVGALAIAPVQRASAEAQGEAIGAVASSPTMDGGSATAYRWHLPAYRLCGPKGVEPLAWVADLHRVSRRTACRVARKIIEYPWPESDLRHFDQICGNRLAKVHRFDGWNVKVPDHGLPRLSRDGAWFSFQGEDFPVGC